MGNQLSFSVTESELMRVEAGKSNFVTVDPRGKGDMIMIIFFSIIYCFSFLAVVYMLRNKNYPPIKAKNPILMTVMIAICAIWFVGDLQTNGHVPLANTPMTNCKPFGLWMRILMGICTLCALVTLRAYGLYRSWAVSAVLLYCVCMLVYGIVAQVLKPEITMQYIVPLDICNVHPSFKASLFWMIRNIKSSFNESREMLIICFIIFANLIFVTTLNYVRPQLALLATSLNHIGTHMLWWLIMAVPMYNYRWINTLRKDGLQNEYDVSANTATTNNTGKHFWRQRRRVLPNGKWTMVQNPRTT
ncbi:hypothetical protein BX661DRAFT_186728 [Kickxella alabastrina]|uniref:uncharacterized protein n=1 Tax=Kickxella alabastrina TaxID=61397 RepID=UPI00221FDB7A|nr:uncharacterized protein BX661DRAFT_186728 [Kickxella alabastrina]KAI7823491.1 hypothetical protein BX661DRAFT_186728 [Kickxella alabastrina]